MIPLKLILLNNSFIFSQLQLEEALLRATSDNYCIINQGSSDAVVMGISGKADKLLHLDALKTANIPLIRRFSGGGTVVVDQNTLFVTFIFNQKEIDIPHQPEAIMRWSEQIYRPVFEDKPFKLRENDYVFEEKKFGGNAQYLCKDRFLHHTSFLWDFDQNKMNYLKIPEKRPTYRGERNHDDFLCTLKPHFTSQKNLSDKIIQSLSAQFNIIETTYEEAAEVLKKPHRQATQLLS